MQIQVSSLITQTIPDTIRDSILVGVELGLRGEETLIHSQSTFKHPSYFSIGEQMRNERKKRSDK
jgi:hypothetical protein